MAPLVFLVLGSLGVRVSGLMGVYALDAWPPALRIGLALMFTATGLAHFIGMRGELIAMVPGPAPPTLAACLGHRPARVGRRRRPADPRDRDGRRALLTALMIVMFPANLHLARTGTELDFIDHTVPRTILQIVFLAACAGAAL